MIHDDTFVKRDASPPVVPPDGIDEDAESVQIQNLMSDRPSWFLPTFITLLIISLFLGSGLFFVLNEDNSSSSSSSSSNQEQQQKQQEQQQTGGDPLLPSGKDSDDLRVQCVVDDVLFQCSSKKSDSSKNQLPDCITETYNIYKEYWVQEVDPLFPSYRELNFCDPQNIALMVVASYANDPKHIDIDLRTIYILTTFFFALNGHDWFASNYWLSYHSLHKWHGVQVNEQGQVISISLPRNHISGTVPPQIAFLETLEYIDLSDNFIEGPLIDDLGSIHTLLLDHNAITGTIPEHWSPPTLRRINLNANELTGSIPSTLFSISSLLEFHASTNYLTGTIPEFATASLEILEMRHNRISGTIPTQISTLQDLQYLDLSGNMFDPSPLPPSLFQLANLRALHLSGCELTGTIPTTIGSMTQLQLLELGMNHIHGRLPTEFGNVQTLTHLDFELNRLTGPIPSQFGHLQRLQQVDVSRNDLTGSLCSAFGRLLELQSFLFAGNRLSGAIPLEVCALWDHGELRQFGTIAPDASCAWDAFGGAACPNDECCRNCPLLAAGSAGE